MNIATKALPFAFLLTACQATEEAATRPSPWAGELQQWGTLQQALRDGQDEGRVRVGDVAREGVFAVGALEGLLGEVTIVDGEIWVSEGSAERATTTRGRTSDAQATVLFAAEVAEWQELPVDHAVDPSVFDAFVAEQARRAGLDPTQPFPFVIEGDLAHLNLHVIAGECPIRARMLGGIAKSPPYALHTEATAGRLVGIYAADSAGVVCHAGAQSHVHALIEDDGGLTGHVESVGLAAGTILRLPRP